MKSFLAGAGVFLLVGLVSLEAQEKAPADVPQGASRPAPDWLGRHIDQGENDPRLKGYRTPEGIKLEIVAASPVVRNPVAVAFSPDGTLHVLDWSAASPENAAQRSEVELTFKDGRKRSSTVLRKAVKDEVKVLRASKDNGVYDEAKAVLSDDFPSALLLHDGYAYVVGQGTLRRYKQAGPEAPLGKPEVIVQGFGGGPMTTCALGVSNDGWLFITASAGDNDLEGADGSRAAARHSGAVFRCRPDGSKLQRHSLGYGELCSNPAQDAGYNLFVADTLGSAKAERSRRRLMHAPAGADFGARLAPNAQPESEPTRHPGTLPPMLQAEGDAATGLCIYNEAYFPEQYRGLLYEPIGPGHCVRGYVLRPKGATFAVEREFDLVQSNDPLFQPCHLTAGPDGAMYLCEGSINPTGTKRGRIYRLSWTGTKEDAARPPRPIDSWASIGKQADAELVKTLESENLGDRQQAQAELVRRGDKQRGPVLALLNDSERPVRARIAALGVLQSYWNEEVQAAARELVAAGPPELRRLSADALGRHAPRGDRAVQDALQQALNDDNLLVRRSVYLAIGAVGGPGTADVLVNALQFDDGKDVYLRDGLVRGLEELGKDGIARLLVLAHSGPGKDLERVLEVYPALRSQAARDGLPRLLQNYHLRAEQKVALIGRDVETALHLGNQLSAGRIPQTLRPQVITALRRYAGDHAEARELLGRIAADEKKER